MYNFYGNDLYLSTVVVLGLSVIQRCKTPLQFLYLSSFSFFFFFGKDEAWATDYRCEQGSNLRREHPIGFQIQRLNLSAITAPLATQNLLDHGERSLLQQRKFC